MRDRLRGLLSRALGWAWPTHPTTRSGLWQRLLPVGMNFLRMSLGGVLAYGLTVLLVSGPVDLTGALTALLVIQASAAGSLKMGFVRVAAVLCGVGIALVVSIWVGLTWWSLGIVIFASLVVGKALRLTDQALEVPISGMLILGASAQDIAAEVRVLTTLIGAAVGMILPFLWPPAVPVPSAAAAVRRVASSLADAFWRASEAVDENPLTAPVIEAHLTDIRAVAAEVGRATERISQVRDIGRWNPRTVGRADVVPLLESGLESLMRCAQASRALFYAVLAEAPVTGEEDPIAEDVRPVFAVVLHDLGSCVDAYGRLIEAEVNGKEAEVEPAVRDSEELLDETKAILTELMLSASGDRRQWLLRGSVLRAVQSILDSLDADRRSHQRAAWRETQARRKLPSTLTTSEVFVDRDRLLQLWRRNLVRKLDRERND